MPENVAVGSPADLAGAGRPGDSIIEAARGYHSQEVYHVLPRRAGALLLDSMLWVVPIIALAFGVGMTSEPVKIETATGWELSEQITFYLSFLQMWAVTCLWFVYLILTEWRFGATLGKRAFGIAIVQSDGETSGLRAVVLRQVPRFMIISLLMLYSLYVLVPVVFLVEVLVARFDEFRQRIGDRLADTVVVPAFYARTLAGDPPAQTAGLWSEAGHLPAAEQAAVLASRGYAGFWPRFFALLVDLLVLLILTEVLAASGLTTSIISTDSAPDSLDAMFSASALLGSVVLMALRAGYFVFLNSRGATLGKRLLGLRVIDASGHAPGMKRAASRYVIPGIGEFVSLGFLVAMAVSFDAGGLGGALAAGAFVMVIGFAYFLFTLYDGLSMLWQERRQTLHDRMGGTFVVRKDESGA